MIVGEDAAIAPEALEAPGEQVEVLGDSDSRVLEAGYTTARHLRISRRRSKAAALRA
jgi:hypothetical protein